jgi:hypothetical protein
VTCSCIEEMDAKLIEHNSRLVPVISFRQGQSWLQAGIRTEKINTRNRNHVGAYATFCPFCGVRYLEESKP